MKCLVSGATGFIGRQLCQQLIDRGDTLVALSHGGGELPCGIPTHAVDLATTPIPDEYLAGVDVVYHLAGIAHQYAEPSAYQQLNHKATVNIAQQAAAAGVRCFIFLSSVKAMGPANSNAARSESECTTPVKPYGASKWNAECALREQFADSAMSLVILRPALVYGSEAKGNLRLLARGVRWGLPRPPPQGGRSMLALPDLVALLCLLGERQPQGVSTWIVCEQQGYSTRAMYELLRRAAGKSSGSDWLPLWGWRMIAGVLDLLSGQSKGSSYEKLFGTELYSNQALAAAIGWTPECKLEHVLLSDPSVEDKRI